MRVLAVSLLAVLLLAGCGAQIPGSGNGGGGGDQPPAITADQEAVRQYRDQVQPILDGTVRDVARVAEVDVQVDGGDVSVGLDPASVEQAEQEAQQGLDELRAIQPPEGLEETHRGLISAYEEGIPALDNFLRALQGGDPFQIAESARNDLPKIRDMLSDIQTVQQQLQQAAG